MLHKITKSDVLKSVRDGLKKQPTKNIDGFTSIVLSNSATNMIRPSYVMSDAARNILKGSTE